MPLNLFERGDCKFLPNNVSVGVIANTNSSGTRPSFSRGYVDMDYISKNSNVGCYRRIARSERSHPDLLEVDSAYDQSCKSPQPRTPEEIQTKLKWLLVHLNDCSIEAFSHSILLRVCRQ